MDVVGYTDRFSVAEGETLTFMISSRSPTFTASLQRLLHGDTNPAGPGAKVEPVASSVEGQHRGIEQHLRPGSYVEIEVPEPEPVASFTVQMWIWPTTPGKADQTLIAWDSVELALRNGLLTLTVGSRSIAVDRAVVDRTWYHVAATFDAGTAEATLTLDPLPSNALGLAAHAARSLQDDPARNGQGSAAAPSMITLAARLPDRSAPAESFYNGKIDSPRVFQRVLTATELGTLRAGGDPATLPGLLAAWDFAQDIPTRVVTDISGSGLHGRTRQRPTRGMTGHNWDGTEESWRHAQHQYGAIHFHDDDLDDAEWEPTLSWVVPAGTPSGVYALHVETDKGADDIPFAVRPAPGTATSDVLFIMPTFSYLAYGDQHLLTTGALAALLGVGADAAGGEANLHPNDRYILDNRLHSLYDHHSDGSGVCYSSPRRPVVNLRPFYTEVPINGTPQPHQFNADLHLVDWLRHVDTDVDVITDHDLHREGRAILDRYRVVLTGTHHEYWSATMLDALRGYLDDGGRLMYLAGNGLYWVTEPDPEDCSTVEIRRRGPSTRAWDALPGEGCLSFTGETGGLWRYRNRAPQQTVGVGFTAQGFGEGRPYRRLDGSRDPAVAWIFDGVADDEVIGDFPNLVCGHGAAGFEFDRFDPRLGTPHHTHLLATADQFSDHYQHVSEEVFVSDSAQGGSINANVRADMVLLGYPNGGAVFSPGAITWCGSLSYNDYDNNVARITKNVLDGFRAADTVVETDRAELVDHRVT